MYSAGLAVDSRGLGHFGAAWRGGEARWLPLERGEQARPGAHRARRPVWGELWRHQGGTSIMLADRISWLTTTSGSTTKFIHIVPA